MLFLLLVLSVLGGGSCSSPEMASEELAERQKSDVQCLIINLEYLKCTWSHGKLPEVNYTFSFKFSPMRNYMNCSRYLQEGGPNIGCIIDKPDRFKKLYINLSHSNGTRVWDQQFDMVNKVKLNPPHNLSVEVNRQNQELWLYWNHSVKSNCRENQVMYRRNEESQWQFSTLLPADFYSLPQASLKSQYEFKVKTRVSNTCGMSEFWSDWGPPVWWYPAEQSNQTGPELGVDFQHKDRDAVTPGRKVLYPVMGVGAFLLLITMAVLLVHGERLRIILIPVVPNPGKNFEDLLKTYNGNVDDWLDIPKEFKDGFQSNYHEPVCSVRECPAPRNDAQGEERVAPGTTRSETLDLPVSTPPPVVPPDLV